MARVGDFSAVVGLVSLMLMCGASDSVPCSGKGYQFQAFTDNQEVTGFPCQLFGKTSCRQFTENNLPNGLSNGSSVDKPRDFAVSLFNERSGNETCPGIEYTWKVPVSELSRSHTKGYFLRMGEVGSGNQVCRTLDLQGLSLNSSKMHFKFTSSPWTKKVTYLVDLFSLPPPSDEEYEAGLYQRVVISLPGCLNLTKRPYSVDWTTWIAVGNPEKGKLKIQFGFAEDSLNFTFETYKVRLFRDGATGHLNETTVWHTSSGVGKAEFENVPSGRFYVQVFADDPYFNDVEKCLCNRGPSSTHNGFECTVSCSRTWTEPFDVIGKPVTTTPSPSTTPPPTTTPAPSPAPPGPTDKPTNGSSTLPDAHTGHSIDNQEPDNTAAVVGAAGGSFALIGCVLIGSVFYVRRRQLKRRHLDMNENNNKPAKHIWGTGVDFPNLTGEPKPVPALRRKRVFLLAAEDHPQHVAAVVKFAEFLRIHCQCDVTFAPLCRPDLRGKIIYCWMAQEIEQADFVVIVTSMAAFRLYQAFQKGQVYKDADLGPEGDLFTPGIQHICGMITLSADVKKVVMVHFEHTVSDYRLPIGALPSSLYLLPKHLGDFLKHVHGLGHYSSALSKVLPLQCDIAQLQEGNDWLTAIQEAKTFERRYPDWFDEKFGKASEVTKLPSAQPLLTTQESGFYSNEGGSIGSRNSAEFQRKLSSVSMGVEGLVSDFDNRERHEPVFTKDDFIEPSMVFSTYTVPPGSTFAGLEMPDEIDDRGSTTSERLRRLNQRYEMDRVEESGGFEATHVPAHEEPSIEDQMRSLNARNEHVHFAPPQVQRVFIFNHQDGVDMEGDCVSISSVQSV